MEIDGVWDISYSYLFFRPVWRETQIASRRLVIERGTVSGRAALLWRCTEVNHYLLSSLYFVSSFPANAGEGKKREREREKEKKGGIGYKIMYPIPPFFIWFLGGCGGRRRRPNRIQAAVIPKLSILARFPKIRTFDAFDPYHRVPHAILPISTPSISCANPFCLR